MTRTNPNVAIRLTALLGCLLCCLAIVPLSAQEPGQIEASGAPAMQPAAVTPSEYVRQRLQSLEDMAVESVQPLPDGETKELRAIVMHTHGRAQWRSGPDAAWQDAAVDDMLESGAMIRTGLKSALTLRVGLNATVLIDSNSRITLPNMLHNGETLETAVKVSRGQADIKVNRVGLTNDFSVVTPTGALAVKGTGFGVRSDAYGTSIVGSRENMMNAIEVQYYASKLAYYLSGGAISSSQQENPTLAALIETAPPPSTNKAEEQDAADADTPAGEAQSSTNPINQTIRIDLAIQQQEQAAEITTYIEERLLEEVMDNEEPYFDDIFELPGFEAFDNLPDDLYKSGVAAAIYYDLVVDYNTNPNVEVLGSYLVPQFFQNNLLSRLDYYDPEAITETMDLILAYGDARGVDDGSPPNPNDLRAILAIVDNFCRQTFAGNEVHIQICRECYGDAMFQAFFVGDYEPNQYVQDLSLNWEFGNSISDGPPSGGEISP